MFECFRGTGVLCCAVLWALTGGATARAQGRLEQNLDVFNTPSAVAFAADGRTLFVANAARGEQGMFAGRGAVSRVVVSDAGELRLDAQKLVDGLNGPMGIAVLPAASGRFPAGTLVVSFGGPWVVDANGKFVFDERERGAGLGFFDPVAGRELGRLYLGEGSPLLGSLGHAVVDPNSVAADPAGNIYIADTAGGALVPIGPRTTSPGIVKLAPGAVEALADGVPPPAGTVGFVSVPEIPTGLAFDRAQNALYWTTGAGAGDVVGAVLRVPRGDFGAGGNIETWGKNLAVLTGVTLTPKGTVLVSTTDGDVLHIARARGKGRVMKFGERFKFLAPGQPAVTRLGDGRLLVVFPEPSGGDRGAWRQRVGSFSLPGDF